MTHSFEDLLGMSREKFESEYFAKRRHVSRAADTGRDFKDLLTLGDLDTILSQQQLRVPLVWVVQDGKQLDVAKYTTASAATFDQTPGYIDSAELYRCLRNGASLVFRQLARYWQPVQDLTRRLSDDIGLPVRANGYITPRESQGLLPHHDDHDVLILQMHGRKEWFEYTHNGDLPVPQKSWMTMNAQALERERAQAKVRGSVILEPGDVLYVPRGSMHAARALGSVSLHITIAVLAITYLDVLEALTKCAVNDRWFRRALPLGSGTEGAISSSAFASEVAEHLAEFVKDSDPVDVEWAARSHAYAEVIRPAVPVFSQYEQAVELSDATMVTVRPGLLYSLEKTKQSVDLRVGGRRISMPATTVGAVELLLSGRNVQVAELQDELTTQADRHKLVDVLLTEGVIECR
jgi:bifunctional lysine-specific demethylase and histidyl-hydroxylase NO66